MIHYPVPQARPHQNQPLQIPSLSSKQHSSPFHTPPPFHSELHGSTILATKPLSSSLLCLKVLEVKGSLSVLITGALSFLSSPPPSACWAGWFDVEQHRDEDGKPTGAFENFWPGWSKWQMGIKMEDSIIEFGNPKTWEPCRTRL